MNQLSMLPDEGDPARASRIAELMRQMNAWGVNNLMSALDFFESGVLTREEAEAVSGVQPKVFSQELSHRRRERRHLMRRR